MRFHLGYTEDGLIKEALICKRKTKEPNHAILGGPALSESKGKFYTLIIKQIIFLGEILRNYETTFP